MDSHIYWTNLFVHLSDAESKLADADPRLGGLYAALKLHVDAVRREYEDAIPSSLLITLADLAGVVNKLMSNGES
ncbi:MAG: hypothetical protein ACE5JI_05710 [Acidobacteriota bacterium]